MEERDTTVSLPARAHKNFGRGTGWTVSVKGLCGGSGMTLALARANAAETVAHTLVSASATPVFATDTRTGALIVAIPDMHGCAIYRLHDGRVASAGYTTDSPGEYIAAIPEYVEIPR